MMDRLSPDEYDRSEWLLSAEPEDDDPRKRQALEDLLDCYGGDDDR